MIDSQLEEFICRIPKAELHCHLEGAIEPRTVLNLAARHGIQLPFDDEGGANAFYEFTSLNQFLEIFALACSTLRTARDFETITVDLGADAARQGILYREVFFTYAYHQRRDIPWQEVVAGIASGRAISRERYGVEMRFIADIDRTVSPDEGVQLVEWAHASSDEAGIIGVGLDSQEIGYPAKRHKPAFDRAAELGLRRVAHAGEDVGPESVWDALDSLGAERIDHGVRSIDDERLVARLAQAQTPLTVCPVSNIALKVFPAMTAHPIHKLMQAGLFVTVNSDDPPMFHTDVVDNYVQVADTFALTAEEIEKLARNSFEGSFMSGAEKRGYLERFDAEAAKLRAELFG